MAYTVAALPRMSTSRGGPPEERRLLTPQECLDYLSNDNPPMDLKKEILRSFKNTTNESALAQLCRAIKLLAKKDPVGGWKPFMKYISRCFYGKGNVSLERKKGLMLLKHLWRMARCSNNRKVLDRRYNKIFQGIVLTLVSDDPLCAEHIFHSALTVMEMAINLKKRKDFPHLLCIVIRTIDKYVEQNTVRDRLGWLASKFSKCKLLEHEGVRVEVFRAILGVAESDSAEEDVRCAAVHVLKDLEAVDVNLVYSLSPMEVKRLLALSLEMLSCIKDNDPWVQEYNWYSENGGESNSFTHGKYLLSMLSNKGDRNIVLAILIGTIPSEYLPDWQKRHAIIMAVAYLPQAIIWHRKQVQRLIRKSLDDEHPRVLWFAINATIHTMQSLSDYEQVPKIRFHVKILAKLASIIKRSDLCPRIQVCAVIAIRFLVKIWGLDRVTSIVDEIVMALLSLLKSEEQKLQEEVVETLTKIVDSIPLANFGNYRDTTILSLKEILSRGDSSSRLLLCAKCLDCLSRIFFKAEHEHEHQNLIEVEFCRAIVSITLREDQLRRDYSSRDHFLKALYQFCQRRELNIDKFINEIMPMVLQCAELDVDQKADTLNDSLDTDKHFGIEKHRVLACNILSECAGRSPLFSQHISKVSEIFVRWIRCFNFQTREAFISALPNLSISVQSGVQYEESPELSLTAGALIAQSLVEALHKETDKVLFKKMLESLPTFIEISGSVCTTELIKIFASGINQLLRKIIEMEKAQEAGTYEIIKDAYKLMITMMKTFEARFLPFVDDLMSTAALLWGDDSTDKVKAFAISIFNHTLQRFPKKLQRYHDQYTYVLFKACGDENSHAQLEAVRGIGFYAMFGGQKFQTIVMDALHNLQSLITKRFFMDGGSKTIIYDAAVSAFGKICEFHRESIKCPKVVISEWLKFLPLKTDVDEARYAHGELSKMLLRSDEDLLGPNNKNLPKILSILTEIISRADLATGQTNKDMSDILILHGSAASSVQGNYSSDEMNDFTS